MIVPFHILIEGMEQEGLERKLGAQCRMPNPAAIKSLALKMKDAYISTVSCFFAYLNRNGDPIIYDGQHRFYAMMQLIAEGNDNYSN